MVQNLKKLNELQLRARYLMAYGQVTTARKERARYPSVSRNTIETWKIRKSADALRRAVKQLKIIELEMEMREKEKKIISCH